MLSLGLAVIFGLLNVINFTHGAQYMMGAVLRVADCWKNGESATGGRCCWRHWRSV
jgi:branched-subunit amino acid ABC-type transport system permease component